MILFKYKLTKIQRKTRKMMTNNNRNHSQINNNCKKVKPQPKTKLSLKTIYFDYINILIFLYKICNIKKVQINKKLV